MGSLADIRDSIRDWLQDDVDEETMENILVIVSEIGANSVTATPSDQPSPVLDAHIDGGAVHLATTNHVETSAPETPRWDLADPLRPGGRGLLVVAAFADDVTIEPHGDLVTVRCTVDIGASD